MTHFLLVVSPFASFSRFVSFLVLRVLKSFVTFYMVCASNYCRGPFKLSYSATFCLFFSTSISNFAYVRSPTPCNKYFTKEHKLIMRTTTICIPRVHSSLLFGFVIYHMFSYEFHSSPIEIAPIISDVYVFVLILGYGKNV